MCIFQVLDRFDSFLDYAPPMKGRRARRLSTIGRGNFRREFGLQDATEERYTVGETGAASCSRSNGPLSNGLGRPTSTFV